MRLPNGEVLLVTDEDGLQHEYDPAKAREYYLRTRKLKGRKRGQAQDPTGGRAPAARSSAAKLRMKRELTQRINNLEDKLQKLEALIKKKETEAKQAAKKSTDKKRKSAKEAAKPDTAAEKAEKARDAKKYRDKNQQKLKSKAGKGSGGGAKKGEKDKPLEDKSVKDLKMLATKARGQLTLAKRKLSAL